LRAYYDPPLFQFNKKNKESDRIYFNPLNQTTGKNIPNNGIANEYYHELDHHILKSSRNESHLYQNYERDDKQEIRNTPQIKDIPRLSRSKEYTPDNSADSKETVGNHQPPESHG
jgi:hypothetical protein